MNSPKNSRLRGLVSAAVLAALLAGCSAPAAESAEEPEPTTSAAAGTVDNTTEEAEPSTTPTPQPTVAPREMESWQLQLGDCFSAHPGEEEGVLGTVDVVPCEQAHESEVYAAMELPAGAYPGEAAVDTQAESFCEEEFEPFVGRPFLKSTLEASTLVPTEESWTLDDDREILCTVMSPFGLEEEGSLKDSKR